jgi:hypothetical protein
LGGGRIVLEHNIQVVSKFVSSPELSSQQLNESGCWGSSSEQLQLLAVNISNAAATAAVCRQ